MTKKLYPSDLEWDATESYTYYPKIIKENYSKIFRENFKKFNLWINGLSKENLNDHSWWLTRLASRDERISSIFHNIVIYKTILKISNYKTNIILLTNSKELKILLDQKNFNNIKIKLKNYKSFPKRLYICLKEISLLLINICLVKVFFKFKHNKKESLNLVDFFDINQKKQVKKYFGNFITNRNANYLYVPTFLNYSPKNVIAQLNKKNILLREYFIEFKDIFVIFKSLFIKKFKFSGKFEGINFSILLNEELKFDLNLRSILIAYQNYMFFKNLEKKNFKISNIISWNENQIIDKGWSLGIKKYYPNANYVAYNGSTLHPQFFNLSPTKTEFLSGAIPKKILIIGKSYLKNRNLFFNKINYKIAKTSRFSFNIKTKKKYILFLLSGIKHSDKVLIDFYEKFKKNKIKNIRIKFHPILPSKSFNKHFTGEIKGDGSQIIKSSYIVITTSYTSGLYESISNNSFTILLESSALDKNLFKFLKNYSSKILLSSDYNDMGRQIKKINNKINLKYKDNRRVKKYFFNC